MKIVSVEQMKAIERAADASGVSYEMMMKNAGRGIANWISRNVSHRQGVIGLVGAGNNGGDTLIALTWMAKWGLRTQAFLVKENGNDALLDDYLSSGGAVVDISRNDRLDFFDAALIPGVVVLDGILGTGFRLPLRRPLHDVMVNIHKRLENRSDLLIIAVDCPSGVDCDTGEVSAATIPAAYTLTMAAMKQGLLSHPARSFAGDLHYIDIGIGDPSIYTKDGLSEMIDHSVIRDLFPRRPDSGHKGTFGTCLMIAGSAPYVGAAYFAGKAAYRMGCGLVHMGVVRDVHRLLAGRLLEAVWTVIPDIEGVFDPDGLQVLLSALQSATAIAIGPGWGVNESNILFLTDLLQHLPPSTPLLIDADALKLLVNLKQWWSLLPDQVVLTPHPGEMSVLTRLKTSEIQSNRWEIASEYAKLWRVNLVLKGALTVIACANGKIFINPVSDPALATAGSGDVLTGVIGGLMAQGVSAAHASVLGVWIHANSGKIARINCKTDMSVTALDLLDYLPGAIVKAKEAGY